MVHRAASPVASLTIPKDTSNHQTPLILDVWDDHSATPFTNYRRIVQNVSAYEP